MWNQICHSIAVCIYRVFIFVANTLMVGTLSSLYDNDFMLAGWNREDIFSHASENHASKPRQESMCHYFHWHSRTTVLVGNENPSQVCVYHCIGMLQKCYILLWQHEAYLKLTLLQPNYHFPHHHRETDTNTPHRSWCECTIHGKFKIYTL